MKKLRLDVKHDYNFYLLGIISKSKDYTVSWAISKSLNIRLKKQADMAIEEGGGEKAGVSVFYFETDFFRITLISNRLLALKNSLGKKLFAPSLRTFDYLLKIEDLEDTSDLDDTFTKIRSASVVNTVVKLDIHKIKEKENFIF